MYVFQRLGLYIVRFVHSVHLFFVFLGHLCHSIKDGLLGRVTISWTNVAKILFYSGAAVIIPLITISAIMGLSLSLNAYLIFSRFNLQNKALAISQDLLTQDLLPLLIGFVLCVQSSLNIITARIKITRFRSTPEEVILDYILPIMIGIDITALLLYTYTFVAILISLYFTFHHIMAFTTHEFFLHIGRNINVVTVLNSVIKTLVYCTIVSLTTGYYYYQVAVTQMNLRKAVSRIFTRGSLWLTVSSLYWKFMHF